MTNPEKSERERLAREIYAARQPKEDWKYEPEDVREMLLITADIVISRESKLKLATEEILEAIRNEGPSPQRHREIMARHRKEWPTLWKSLDEISKAVK